jgi:N-acetylglucosaminyldiphosphoundecaprenol N-acetyl-beta-D-mannosaminyltransferase
MSIASVDILGVRVDNVTTSETLEIIQGYVKEGTPHQIVTVNPEFVMKAQRNAAFHHVLDQANLALPDGYGLLWASRVLGSPLRERVTGSDTLPLIAQMSAREGYSLFLLGAAPGVAERTATILQGENEGLRIAGTFPGSPDPARDEELVSRVRAADPEILFVAYGAPQQDLWIHRNLERIDVPVCMGVGGAFDFIAGVTQRAPVWLRERGLEWLHRLIHEPWRWRRMLALPAFACRVVGRGLADLWRKQ